MLDFAWPPEPYFLVLAGFGALIALVVWLPQALKRLPLSLPIVCVAIGMAVFAVPGIGLKPLPTLYPQVAERFSEFVVIIALMGAGLKLDRPFHWRRWGVTWRLLLITMPLSIAAMTWLGTDLLGLPLAAALLLAASLSPTDPVLASDVQVGPPKSGEEDEVRFGLTSEAGLNDGLAFPFVHLAILLAGVAALEPGWLGYWAGIYVVWKAAVGILAGWAIGRLFGWLTFRIPGESKLAQTGDGLIAIAATFLSYGLTELVQGYGFFAVFVTALTIRGAHRHHEFNRDMHDITEQVERIAMMVLLVLFGGALISGLLAPLRWIDIAGALAILLLVRPVAGVIGLIGNRTEAQEKLVLAFFGIRGVGSVYYLAYAVNQGGFDQPERLWAITGLVILLSILLHGLTVTPVMRQLDRTQGRDPDEAVA